MISRIKSSDDQHLKAQVDGITRAIIREGVAPSLRFLFEKRHLRTTPAPQYVCNQRH